MDTGRQQSKVLVCRKPKGFSRTYGVFDGEKEIGRLHMRNWGYSSALAESPGGSWNLAYKGFSLAIVAENADTHELIAKLRSGGLAKPNVLERPGMGDLFWRSANWCGSRYGWFTEAGDELMRFKLKWQWKNYAEIEAFPGAEQRKDYAFLLLLGVYKLKITELTVSVVT